MNWQKLLTLDRRWIYLLMGVFVVGLFFVHLGLPIVPTSEVRSVYDQIEKMGPQDRLWLAVDFDNSTAAECQPMVLAIMHHAFKRNVPLILTAYQPPGLALAQTALAKVAPIYGKKENQDYVLMGIVPTYAGATMLLAGVDFKSAFTSTSTGMKSAEVPILANVRNYSDFNLVVTVAASSVVDNWIAFAHGRYNANVAIGVTGVMATNYYPFLQTNQLSGLIGGLKGAAEYETLVGVPGRAARGMDIQSITHLLVLGLIGLGNLAFFMDRRSRR